MEAELKEILDDLESLERSLPDPSHHASIDMVLSAFHHPHAAASLHYMSRTCFLLHVSC